MRVNENNDTVSIAEFLKDSLNKESGHIYLRMAQGFKQAINQGVVKAGFRLPAHRILADALDVTPGTVSRAYRELAKMGLVVSRVGDGTYINDEKSRQRLDDEFTNVPATYAHLVDLSRNLAIDFGTANLISQAMDALQKDQSQLATLIGYTPDTGIDAYRQSGALWMNQCGVSVAVDEVVCTNGAQHALMCALMTLLKEGEALAAEFLSYPGMVSLAKRLRLRLVGIAMDEQGILPAALDAACNKQKISTLYCTPSFQNPTSVILSRERREALVDVCNRHNIMIIEDGAGSALAPAQVPTLKNLAPERTVFISSLSKVIAAGIRVGYMAPPRSLLEHVAKTLRATSWMPNPLAHGIASHWINSGILAAVAEQQKIEIQRRHMLVVPHLKSLEYNAHRHCGQLWVKVPAQWRTGELVLALKKQGVLVLPSSAFCVDKRAAPRYIRVCLTGAVDDASLVRAAQCISATIQGAQEAS
ncbi:PLP-dependent aminotransferase family protein [Teredinibacter turnerae]|uniref:aminotransferase-like domain-containing protein n=1 Tax=Teredinibacter turnerae TaxID=2426 RepID=UPI0003693494|nr:PLP-dependent aminotransferase family protein [Teredinibacter turnerae]